jgi:hypothetical protein
MTYICDHCGETHDTDKDLRATFDGMLCVACFTAYEAGPSDAQMERMAESADYARQREAQELRDTGDGRKVRR